MTISSETSRVSYSGNGATVAFSFPYYFGAQADLVVIDRVTATGVETVKVLTTDYTISGTITNGVYKSGGTVTMNVAPASGHKLIIYRDPAATQETDFVENDSLPAETLETTLDKLTAIAQRLQDRVDRSVTLSEGYTDTFNPALPNLLTAGGSIIVNAAGTALEIGANAADIAAAGANATAAAASAAAAAVSAAGLGAAFVQDVVYLTSASSPVTLVQADNGKLYSIDSSGGAISITLPTISGITTPYNVGLKLKTGGNTVTVNRAGSDTINGATSKTLTIAGTGFKAIADTSPAPNEWTTLDYTEPSGAALTSVDDDDTFLVNDVSAFSLKTVTAKNFNKLRLVSISDSNSPYSLPSHVDTILATNIGGALTINLPAAASHTGRVINFIRTNAANNNTFVIDPNGAETVGNLSTINMIARDESLSILSDGTNWRIVEHRTNSYLGAISTTSNFTNTTIVANYWKRGDRLIGLVKGTMTGTPGAASLTITLPNSWSVDTAKQLYDATTNAHTGVGTARDNSATATYAVFSRTASGSPTQITLANPDDAAGGLTIAGVTELIPFTWAINDSFEFGFEVPISGWDCA